MEIIKNIPIYKNNEGQIISVDGFKFSSSRYSDDQYRLIQESKDYADENKKSILLLSSPNLLMSRILSFDKKTYKQNKMFDNWFSGNNLQFNCPDYEGRFGKKGDEVFVMIYGNTFLSDPEVLRKVYQKGLYNNNSIEVTEDQAKYLLSLEGLKSINDKPKYFDEMIDKKTGLLLPRQGLVSNGNLENFESEFYPTNKVRENLILDLFCGCEEVKEGTIEFMNIINKGIYIWNSFSKNNLKEREGRFVALYNCMYFDNSYGLNANYDMYNNPQFVGVLAPEALCSMMNLPEGTQKKIEISQNYSQLKQELSDYTKSLVGDSFKTEAVDGLNKILQKYE